MTHDPRPSGRRERKKAATRRGIADAALRMFRERGYESVGIREIAAEADVAVTTLFAHFPSKEALVFEQAAGFEARLIAAVTERSEGASVVGALHEEIGTLVQHCTTGDATGIWRMIDQSPELSTYAQVLELRYARAIAASIGSAPALATSEVAANTIARFAMAAFTLARQSADPRATLDESFRMIEAAWAAARPSQEK
ncbi:TetR/AcrR family transcriptional regulator [Actinoalloteichus hoggarensis]|uniref:TetR/AcrR family transcriptional regulator n=1 Tax=Actinoalloteichus hoggarensis TaxID=1470176 RepID=UPI000B8A6DB3|nr:TetR/AcrR family transcriptional regulator [Actinoalloteichus hoggarensis]